MASTTRARLVAIAPPSRRRLLQLLCFALGYGAPSGGREAEAGEAPAFRVIVHPSNTQRAVDRAFVADAFLKKVTRWSDGGVIRAADLRPDHPARRRFSEEILKRSVRAVRSYWQQRIFSGRDVPPVELDSDDSVVSFVAAHAGAIGYVSSAAKLAGVSELGIR